MSTLAWAIIITLVLAAAMMAGHAFERRRFRSIAMRPDAAALWNERFAGASDAAVVAFLQMFTDEMGISHTLSAKFRPDDRVMDVYRLIYPPGLMGVDQLELESLELTLRRRYSVALSEMWHDEITLGEIFGRTLTA